MDFCGIGEQFIILAQPLTKICRFKLAIHLIQVKFFVSQKTFAFKLERYRDIKLNCTHHSCVLCTKKRIYEHIVVYYNIDQNNGFFSVIRFDKS